MKNYGGFWLRFLALIIDAIIIGLIRGFIVFPILGLFGLSLASGGMFDGFDFQDPDAIAALIAAIIAMAGVVGLISTIIWVLYYSLMEASKFQATVGKLALGLVVTDVSGQKLDFTKALVRNLCKILSSAIFLIGYLMAAFTEKKQALHDIIANTLVVKK